MSRSLRCWLPVILLVLLILSVYAGTPRMLISQLLASAPTTASQEDPLTVNELKKLVQQAALSGDAASLAEVLRTIGKMPGREPAAAVLSSASSLSRGPDDIYWFLLQGVAGFKGPDAFTEMGEFVVRYRSKPISRDLLNSLRKCKSKYVNRVIRRVLADCPADMQLMAVDIAAEVPVRRTVDILLPVLARENLKDRGGKKPETALKLAIISALDAVVSIDIGLILPPA